MGWTPLAAAMAQAEAVLQKSSTPGEQVIYLVSDGEEACGGDPVGTARRINAGPTRAIVDIIGFGVPSKEAEALQSVAKAGGGAFVHVRTKRAFDETMAIVRDSNRVAGNAVRASDAISANAVNTSDTATRASTCISNIIADESNRMSNDLAARAGRGEQVPYMSGALALLRARHQGLQARVKAFAERLETAEHNAQATINKASEVAK
ncbi:MAG TPA: hypothetical protein VNZ61_16695 [Roseomonas sp.]|nr:hypothetical protein [Roseomonas sp.]